MRDRMERFVILPFSVGCISQSSVAVSENTQPTKKSHGAEANPSPMASPRGESFEGEKTKSSSIGSLPLPRRNISAGLQRLVKGFKELFTVYSREDEDDEEEVGEMEIGFPTDVKHVAHIGWDGTTGVLAPPPKRASWDVNGDAPQLLSLPSISFRHFELAMAAQPDPPLSAAGALRLA